MSTYTSYNKSLGGFYQAGIILDNSSIKITTPGYHQETLNSRLLFNLLSDPSDPITISISRSTGGETDVEVIMTVDENERKDLAQHFRQIAEILDRTI